MALLTISSGCAQKGCEPREACVIQNGLQVSLALDPNPPRIGSEVMLIGVRDARTKDYVAHAKVRMTASPMSASQARVSQIATDPENTGLYGANITLRDTGRWLFDISVADMGRTAHLRVVQNVQ